MTERFKQQLKDYTAGKLSAEERAQVEQEIAKLEVYQEHMDELLFDDNNHIEPPVQEQSIPFNPKQARKIMNQGKRRARYWSVGTVFGLLLLLSLVNSIVTSLFYSTGEPARQSIYGDVLESAIAVTNPNISVAFSSSPGGILSMKYYGNMTKVIGSEHVTVGRNTQTVRFNQMIGSTNTYSQAQGSSNMMFYLPEATDKSMSKQEWARLEKLPEGTVAEAFISFDHYYTTDAALKLFEDKEVNPVWLAVYKGESKDDGDGMYVRRPLGFPSTPIWHHGDGETIKYGKQKTGLFSSSSSSSTSYPGVETYGDGKLRNDNFIDTLKLINKYKSVARSVIYSSEIKDALTYVEANGVTIYGMVVTGPTKELLKLRETSFVQHIRIGEVRLWNWTE